ncbi:MAG: hypothetical protein KJ749_12060 [Planctomycetes bacterium]|nr:hypothetical protein [Planctomycetota bacterium]
MKIAVSMTVILMSYVHPSVPGLTREEAEAQMARICQVYSDMKSLDFKLDIAQGLYAYSILAKHTPDSVAFKVYEKDKLIYEATVEYKPDADKSGPTWLIHDKNYTVGGRTSSFSVSEESFNDGWLSSNDENIIACFTHLVNCPIVGPRSTLVRLIDKLLGTRADLLPMREYMEKATYVAQLKEQGYIGSDFPTERILHIWRREAGIVSMGNPGTYIVTLCMDGNEWIVLRRMTARDEDVTVKDSWTVDPDTGLIKQWDRDFGHDLGMGRIRTRAFEYNKASSSGLP